MKPDIIGLRGEGIVVSRRSSNQSLPFTLKINELDLKPGSRIALMGPNGCGKTTALSLLSLALAPNRFDHFSLIGSDQSEHPFPKNHKAEQIRRHNMGVIQQASTVLPFLKVRERLLLRLKLAEVRNRKERIAYALSVFDLEHLADRHPEQLSQGQRQRVNLAITCAMSPRFLIADEPTASMDTDWTELTFKHLSTLSQKTNACVVIATHNPILAAKYDFRSISFHCNEHETGIVSEVSIVSGL